MCSAIVIRVMYKYSPFIVTVRLTKSSRRTAVGQRGYTRSQLLIAMCTCKLIYASHCYYVPRSAHKGRPSLSRARRLTRRLANWIILRTPCEFEQLNNILDFNMLLRLFIDLYFNYVSTCRPRAVNVIYDVFNQRFNSLLDKKDDLAMAEIEISRILVTVQWNK